MRFAIANDYLYNVTMTKDTNTSLANTLFEAIFANAENGDFTEEEIALMLKVLDQVEKQGYFEPDPNDSTIEKLLKKLDPKKF